MEKITSRNVLDELKKHHQQLQKYQVKKIGLFGSVARGEATANSDLDFLVVFKKVTFDNYMDLKFFLEKLFKKKVDLVTEKSLKPALNYVREEVIYAKIA